MARFTLVIPDQLEDLLKQRPRGEIAKVVKKALSEHLGVEIIKKVKPIEISYEIRHINKSAEVLTSGE